MATKDGLSNIKTRRAGGMRKSDWYWKNDGNRRTFYYTLISNSFFVVASVLYVWLAVVGIHYEAKIQDIPDEILQADDDVTWYGVYDYEDYQDDYVFDAITKRNVYVSRYQVLYFAAALCFVLTGVMDVLYKPGWYGAVMFLAGSFGLLSAVFVEKDEWLAIVFNSVSVHLFLIEAAALLFWRTPWPGLYCWFLVADTLFVIGALMDVVLSYVIVRDNYNHSLSHVALVASICWLITALIYFCLTLFQYKGGACSIDGEHVKDLEFKVTNGEEPPSVPVKATSFWPKPDQTTESEVNSERQSVDLAAESGEI